MTIDEIRVMGAKNYQAIMKAKVRHDQSDLQLMFTHNAKSFEARVNFKILDVIKYNQIMNIKSDSDRI